MKSESPFVFLTNAFDVANSDYRITYLKSDSKNVEDSFTAFRMTGWGISYCVLINNWGSNSIKVLVSKKRFMEECVLYYVYILVNWNNKILYTGMTNNLERRLYEHKNKLIPGFTSKYNLRKLVYFECMDEALTAIEREKQIKKLTREKKEELVYRLNPLWMDLQNKLT